MNMAASGTEFVPSKRGAAGPSISAEDRVRYERMFSNLLLVAERSQSTPMLSGDRMKDVFLRSGLSPKVLGVIWEKSDLTKDGKLDRSEFAVAMCLIEHVLGGNNIPPHDIPRHLFSSLSGQNGGTPSLPRQPSFPSAIATPPPVNSAPGPQRPVLPGAVPAIDPFQPHGFPPRPPMPGNAFPAAMPPGYPAPPTGAPPPLRGWNTAAPVNEAQNEWLIPLASQTKYRSQFVLNDPAKSGLIGANVARNLLLQTQVDTNTLARIWDLSNIRGQGNLNMDEFILAMHLCDLVKAGEQLPVSLPRPLVPPSLRRDSAAFPLGPSNPQHEVGKQEAADQSNQKLPTQVSFEDKRKQNFDLGEQALERKRQALLEQQKREQEERMRKERLEEERKARERAELERKRAEQMAEQHRRLEEARREAEARAQAEQDRKVAVSLESRIAEARNSLTQLRSQNSQLDSDIQVLAAKKSSLDQQLQEARDCESKGQTSAREKNARAMERKQHLEKLQLQLQSFQKNLKMFSDKKLSIADQLKQQASNNPIAERHSQTMASLEAQQRKVSNLKQQISLAETETASKFHNIDLLHAQLTECKALLANTSATGRSRTDATPKQVNTAVKVDSSSADKYKAFSEAVVSSNPANDPFAAPSNQNSASDWFSSSDKSTADDIFGQAFQPSSVKETAQAVESDNAVTNQVLFEALYDFSSNDEGDLPFSVGDIICASADQNLDEPWLAGYLNGVGGWFPQNYTKRVSLSSTRNSVSGSVSKHTPDVVSSSSTGRFSFSSEHNTTLTPKPEAAAPVCKVKALFAFEPTAEGDLRLSVGDEVCVTSKEGDWWEGYLSSDPSSTRGIFPNNFVEEIPSANWMATASASPFGEPAASMMSTSSSPGLGASLAPPSTGPSGSKTQELASVIANFQGDSPEQLSLVEGQVVIVKKRLPSGWWEGQIQGEKGKGWFPGDYVRLISSGLTPLPSANSSPERKSDTEKVRAQFAFTAERADEISFNEGDVISVVAKDNPDWWRGELNGSIGLFPSSFVSPLKM